MEENARPASKEKSIRLFENDFLEMLTHVHPIVPLLVWAPVAGYLLWQSVTTRDLSAPGMLLIAILALLVWTLTEYTLHRFVFHYPAKSRLGKYLVFMFHGVHHDAPRDKTRLVMPPAGSILIMLVLWQLFRALVPAPWFEAFVGFFIVGYLVYDYTHYATHHFPMRHPVLHFLKVYHLQHHYGDSNQRFGVSSPLWDRVFGTWPTEQRAGRI